MDNNRYKVIIGIISIAIPLVVAILLFLPGKEQVEEDGWIYFLPHLNGIINSATCILLIAGFSFIKSGRKDLHKTAMVSAFVLGTIFLVSYITYHANAGSTVYGDLNGDGVLSEVERNSAGFLRTLYLILLLTHIVLAAIVVPFVLLAFYFALTEKFDRHKRIVKFTLPIWLYVSVSGVVVYLMISQYY